MGFESLQGHVVVHPLWRPFDPRANVARQAERVAVRQTRPGPVQDHEDGWADDFEAVHELVVRAIDGDALELRHVGSTAVAGLIAKPIIDVDLTVADVERESTYAPRLESVGFRLIFRDRMAGDAHRQMTLASPNANLHVWNPGAVEPQRHALFTAWLESHPEDRELYASAKRAALSDPTSNYNDAKAAVVYDIYERVFAADPARPHDPRPRSG